MAQMVHGFGGGTADGDASMKDLLGGKGANLAEMARLGLPVPAGFTLTTEVCNHYSDEGRRPPALEGQVAAAITRVEGIMGGRFGDTEDPLLLSVRSGAPVSMPGMMDTVLNLGLNDEIVEGLARRTGDRRFAFDAYRRLLQMYGDVVLGISGGDPNPFEARLEAKKQDRGVQYDVELDAEALEELVGELKSLIEEATGEPFPQDPRQQLWGAIEAVFESWDTPRAVAYRKIHEIPSHWGTAANVQAMVFGNRGSRCATGVAFTRDPSNGERRFYGEYLVNAQGEDVVAGIRTPLPLNRASKAAGPADISMEEEFPEAYAELDRIRGLLEAHYKDMQDVEFTVQDERLWMLQTRSGKRTGPAAVRIAVDMLDEGLIEEKEALQRVEPEQLTQLLVPVFDRKGLEQAREDGRLLATGLAAGPGAATGVITFSADEAVACAAQGSKAILVRIETSPDDIQGMHAAEGILTSRGGMTSHAAVVARGMGKTCVAGCGALEIDYATGVMRVAGKVLQRGDAISLDGGTGEVFAGTQEVRESQILRVLQGELAEGESSIYGAFERLLTASDRHSRLGVRTNADTPHDARIARRLGARGIGLCRTEHMFFEGERITSVRKMILAKTEEGRKKALAELLPMQRRDFDGIFRAMDGLPVTIRTLDPPLHEFLPREAAEIAELAQQMGVSTEHLQSVVAALEESNPMLGHRGCRLGIAYPEITAMQARAIFEAAVQVAADGVDVLPEVMIPLVAYEAELEHQRRVVVDTAEAVFAEAGRRVDYLVGTMIELPRACLVAERIAAHADFFSFGTNDLTQTTLGLSRDDAGRFLPLYLERGIYDGDPFARLDRSGVGQLVVLGTQRGRLTKPDLKVGICGEHGGEPTSIAFCHGAGLDYVSCSPYRVPVARLAAAQAVLREG